MKIKERPILFSAPMVRAIIDGKKTMTRRIIKPQPADIVEAVDARCPYGIPGDRLWVRETWQILTELGDESRPFKRIDECRSIGPVVYLPSNYIIYRADGECFPINEDGDNYRADGWERSYWKPSIHMPRWASRILLEITEIRVERLQDITIEDVIAEGILSYEGWKTPEYEKQLEAAKQNKTKPPLGMNPLQRFWHLWESINGPGSWEQNPRVRVVVFKVIEVKK